VKIRTQFTIIVVLFSAILVAVGASLILINLQVERLQTQESIAHDLELGARELSYLTNDYLLHRESQQRARWEAKYASFSDLQAGFAPGEPEHAALVRNIKANRERLKTIFTDVASTFENLTPAGGAAAEIAMIRVSWSRLEVQNQGMAFDASRLARILEDQANQLRHRQFILLFVLIAVFGAFLVINYVTVNRRILRAVSDLQAGARIIGSGNLEFAIEEKKADEIGDLSRAFNHMAADLKALTASKTDLEREMNERRQVEEALKVSETKYRNLFENMAEEVHFWQVVRNDAGMIMTWRLVDANPPTLKSWGRCKVEEIKGKTTDEIFGPGATEHYLPVVHKIMAEGVPYSFEDYFQNLDRYFRFTSVPLGDYFITTGADITEIKKTEEKLRRLSQFPEENPNPVLRCTPKGIVLYANAPARHWLATLGWQVDGPLPTAVQVAVAQAGGQDHAIEAEITNPAGRTFSITCVQPPGENHINLYGIDFTDRKQTQIALERSNRELEQFAYVASHDLQEPLRAVVGFLQLLQNRYGDQIDEKGRHFIERSVQAGHRMQTLIRELLKLSRVNTKGATFASTDLNHLVADVLDNLQSIIKEKNTEIICAKLPTLEIDAGQIQSLFQNLIMNAVIYNESTKPSVEIGCREHDSAYQFFVKDNGLGISPRFYQRIFMVFQRLHTDREYSGTGLGLALCKTIVERHGGTIWVESQLKKGSIFYFTLPQKR
jgi:signal transduction histidine kinase/HAMP domain-containing protein